MISYLLHVALLIAVCLLFYKTLLQKETFYRLNRAILIACLALAFILPLISIPQQWSFKHPEQAVRPEASAPHYYPSSAGLKTPQYITVKRYNKLSPASVKAFLRPAAGDTAGAIFRQVINFTGQPGKWLLIIYWTGLAAFALNLIVQLCALLYQSYSRPAIRDGKFRIVELSGDKAPCSFGNTIFINPEKYDWETYRQILLHEKIHVRQRHTFDILIAELAVVVQWFNPFAWLYRKELENNLEFLTDSTVLKNDEIEPASYQLSLLRVSASHLSLSITTNYNQSLLKRRIVMMNTKRSNLHIMWKYFVLAPLLGLLACALNDPAAYSQDIKAADTIKKEAVNTENSTRTAGNWFAAIKGDKIKIEFKSDDNNKDWSSSSDFSTSEFHALPRDKSGDFTLTRDAGTVLFTGRFDGASGRGHFKFTADKSFKDFLNRHDIAVDDDRDDFAFFVIDIKRSYVEMLENNGYKGLSKNDLIAMAALKVDEPYIRMWRKNGYAHLTANQLVSGKALGLTDAYLEDIHRSGYSHLGFDQLISFKATGVTGKYISGLHSAGAKGGQSSGTVKNLAPDDVVSVKVLNVDPAYISSLQKEGYSGIPANELISMKSVGVTPEFIESFKAAGYSRIPANELVSMKATGVTADFAKSLEVIGYKNIPVNELVSFKAMNITPEFVKSFEGAGYKMIPYHELTSVKALGITPEFIKGFSDIGYKNVPMNTFSSLKALGVTPEFIDGFKKLGYENITLDEATSLKATGVTPAYVNEMREKGFKSQDLNKYIQLKSAFN